MMAHAQGCVVQQLQLGRAVNSQQDLDPLSRELLILLAAHLDEGEYVWRQHVPIAVRHGASEAKIDALAKGAITSKAFSPDERRSEEHTSELQLLMRISYAYFALK